MNPHLRPLPLARDALPRRLRRGGLGTARVVLTALGLLCCGVASCPAADILILLSGPGEQQNAFAATLGTGLETDPRHRVRTSMLGDANLHGSLLSGVDMVVTVGAPASRYAVREGRTPVLATLIARQEATELRQQAGKLPLAAIVLDQPVLRTLNLTRLVAPGATSVAALFAADNAAAEAVFRSGASSIGLKPRSAVVNDESLIGPALDRLLAANEVLVALPDARIFNRNTAMSILLTSYRYRRPVIGFSEAYVRAGAVAAVFSSPADIARQAAEWLLQAPTTAQLANQIREPRYFRVVVNQRVAEALGLELPEAEGLAQALRNLEASR